ncbi:MAG: hypothetical protein NO475_02135 [Candidatus Methanomethylicia archaeon]|jgi:hypothetical protein|uniref:Uncharacterized protein n=1 Tax=Thermoproteota archaeon TaxID=2056631 RepID=A0A520KFI6_9CREN|nr:hypothetical protein [Candidatus Methanomethylicia archaeon]MCQ5340703.1 hypothetical protein [Candidatus Methanomethylicia archaeon]NHV45988.1 hypothetical protein [Candidatus Verstraetearchaeota archaeon]RZN56227.1 MAG: hypothetical protein EF809_03345 [Candidatus Verstraetearchaeota archaeon]TDA37772.1 MAG: hypothetical protein DSO09_06215 [Candidatus Verstraetearchaeota archaeon]
MSENKIVGGIFTGSAKIGEMLDTFMQLTLTPQDITSPIALQMALSRIYETMTKTLTSGPKKRYIAEVRFTDSLGNPVVIGLDLGEKLPPFTSNEVKARILIELFEEQR